VHPVDRLSGISKRCMEGARPTKNKPGADPQVGCRYNLPTRRA